MMPIFIKIRLYLQLLRVHHWIKNILIFIPLFFSVSFLNPSLITGTIFGFICFSLLSSIVYILNDIKDVEKDRLHSTKCRRPLASGEISVSHAIVVLVILSILLIFLFIILRIQGNRLYNLKPIGLMLLYMVLNIAYSWGLKNIPIVDVTILASGYIIRVLFGSMIIGVNISVWLYLMITLGAYYMGLGKRRNEITDFIWMMVLSRVEVSFAYAFSSLGYVLVIVMSIFILKENISIIRIIGVGIVCFGIILVSKS
ncbi:MAG: UbiA prenyltransferase family protein [Treponema sp.]|nr:UbiA prenyltransferase family protein [Treponema sp.]